MSRSVRISKRLFDSTTTTGVVLSRSAAQQLEHWARLGKALEATGLTVDAAKQWFDLAKPESAEVLWRHKRARQAKDLKDVASGRASQTGMYLFTPEAARKAKILNGPY